jgi:hypothetical protein
MSVKFLNESMPAVAPVPPPAPPMPAVDPAEGFAPSAELDDQLRRLQEAQVVIDRREAEELARLREIQNRD